MHERPTGYEPHRHLTGDVTRLYLTLLGREPDNGGLNHFTNALRTRGMSMLDVRETMIRSEEGTNRLNGLVATGNRGEAVNMLYQGLLARNVHDDAVGRSVYVETERSITDIRDEILRSGEYQQRREVGNQIVQFYFDTLQRSADDDGLNHYIRQVQGNVLSVEQVRNAIDGSEEASVARTVTPLTQWQRYQEEQKSLAEERARQAEEHARERGRRVEEQAQERAKQIDRARLQEEAIGIKTCQELSQEIRNAQLDQIVRGIQQDWQSQTSLPVTLSEEAIPEVSTSENGTIDDRSRVELRLTYTHPDAKLEDWTVADEHDDELFIPMEGFTEQIQVTRTLRIGIVNAPQRSYYVGIGDEWGVFVPIDSPNALSDFFLPLFNKRNSIAPKEIISEANERIAKIGQSWER